MTTKKKSKLLLVSAASILGLGIGSGIAIARSAAQVNAASFHDETFHDEFTSINEEVYDKVDAGDHVQFVERNGVLIIGGMDFNVGYVRTAEKLNRGTKTVVFEFNQLTTHAGWLCPSFSNGYSWPNMVMAKFAGAQVFANGSTVPHTAGTGAETQWQVTNSYSGSGALNARLRIVWNNDGSAKILGSADSGATFTEICYWDAGVYTMPSEGYVGFYGNGLTDSVQLDSIKVGLADDANLTNLSWIVEDEFETASSGKFVVDTAIAAAPGTFKQEGGLQSAVISNAGDGEGLILKQSYSFRENASKLFSAQLTFTPNNLGEQIFGLGFGLGTEAASTSSAHLVGVRKVGDDTQLVAKLAGEELVTAALPELSGTTTLNVLVEKDANGEKVTVSVGGVALTHALTNAEGRLAIALSGESTGATYMLSSLTVTNYVGAIEEGRDLSIDFSNGIDHNWLANASEGDTIAVEDGTLHFASHTDASTFSTRQRYANFDLQFDVKMQLLEEDDEGSVTPASSWMGVSIGRDTPSQVWYNDEMFYATADTMNSLQPHEGHVGATATSRLWFASGYEPVAEANRGKVFHYHFTAVDGELTFSYGIAGEEEFWQNIVYHDVDTVGYISFVGTNNSGYWLDNITLVNLDGTGVANNAPVAVSDTNTVTAGETIIGNVVAHDEDEYDEGTLTYEIVEDNTGDFGTLEFYSDGSYSFVADEEAEDGVASFTFRAFDTEDYSEIATIDIHVSAKEVVPPDTSSDSGSSITSDPDTSTPPTSVPDTSTPTSSSDAPASRGGCGGAIAASLAGVAIAAAGITAVAIRRSKKDK